MFFQLRTIIADYNSEKWPLLQTAYNLYSKVGKTTFLMLLNVNFNLNFQFLGNVLQVAHTYTSARFINLWKAYAFM